MANPKKTYFLTPSFDFAPAPTGPIKLGNIIANPASPDRPLNPKATLVPPPPESIQTTCKTDWKSTLSKSNSASLSVYAKFLELILGAGVDAGVNWDRRDGEEYAFDKLETIFFNPLDVDGYLERAIQAPNVKRFIEKSNIRKPVYMVTGLKIVRGGKIKSSKIRGHGGAVSIGLDGTALAAPVQVGPELEIQREKGEAVEWAASDDFVFAYRLSKIKVKRRANEVREEEYVKGALYDLETPKDGGVEALPFEIDEIEGDEAIASDFGDKSVDADDDDDDGGVCICVLPQKQC
jgi:hypothetical protein